MFEYTITREDPYPCVTAQGRIDALSATEIQKVFHQLILEGARVLLIDLSGVHYVSSAGLRIFIMTQRELRKVGGEVLLAGLTPQVLDIFKVSGFDQFFRIAPDRAGCRALASAREEAAAGKLIRTEEAAITYIEKDAAPGSIFIVGSTGPMEKSAYGETDVVVVPASRMRAGCGLATLGESWAEYRSLFGEAMVIHGNFFYYPAVRHPSVDFILNAHSDLAATYKFLQGFGVTGDERYLLTFKSEKNALDLTTLARHFLAVSKADLIGVTILAECRGLWGMNIKKPPIREIEATPPENIFASSTFSDWFDFPVEPAHAGAVVAATGIVARHPGGLPPALQTLFPGENFFHLHGAIFDKAPIGSDPGQFDRELTRIFNELNVFKIQHLLGQSQLTGGMAGIVEIGV